MRVDLAVFAEISHAGDTHEHGWYCTNCKRHFKNLFSQAKCTYCPAFRGKGSSGRSLLRHGSCEKYGGWRYESDIAEVEIY
jgi:hypothetical protein